MKKLAQMFKSWRKEDSGQGITEYGALLSFVALLIILVSGAAKGGLQPAIETAFKTVTKNLDDLNKVSSPAAPAAPATPSS